MASLRSCAGAVMLALPLATLPSIDRAWAGDCASGIRENGRVSQRCRQQVRPEPFRPEPRLERERNVYDLGNGTELRVGGRVQADFGVRR